jgi:general nucleoside transport system ATP-binding protein
MPSFQESWFSKLPNCSGSGSCAVKKAAVLQKGSAAADLHRENCLTPYLKMQNITKVYPANNLKANDSVSLEVVKGEIHALVGENGAGKTTLMNILYGLEQPDSGTIYLNGAEVRVGSPMVAHQHGIGMVHQHFKLIQEFTVAENVVLGMEPLKRKLFFDRRRADRTVAEVIEENNFHLTPAARISELSVGQLQQVEIVKMLYRRADLLILDEPTSVLTEQEIQRLFKTLRYLAGLGKTIILITHKLGEVKSISDRITVMRKGEVAAVRDTAEVDEYELSRLMVGKRVMLDFDKEAGFCSEPILSLRQVTAARKHQDRPLLDNISFSASTCEIVGITGVAGNGLSELEDVISGLMPVSSGTILYNDIDVTHMSAMELRKTGFSYVPTDRLKRGSSLASTIRENMIITNHHDYLTRGGLLDGKRIESHVEELIAGYQIDGRAGMPIGTLSGGNIQKVILARELEKVRDLVLFAEPTWGLDVAGSEFIYQKILDVRKRGAAVILISSNLDEILAIADTVIVLYRGRIVMKRPVRDDAVLSRERIGEYMLGLKDDFQAEREVREGYTG